MLNTHYPQLVGILNLTPDSFSDGGTCADTASALHHATQMIADGADVIDMGAESTRPGATPLDAIEEWQRLETVLPQIIALAKDAGILTSLDTRHPATAEKAMGLGIDWINDVSGIESEAMVSIVKNSTATTVMMHNLGIPASKDITIPEHEDPVKTVFDWAEERLNSLENLGISRTQIIFDPGIGFGKTAQQSLVLLKNIEAFKKLGIRILVGHSRKSFLEAITPVPANQRDIETLATSWYLSRYQVDYLRVHNVGIHRRAFSIISTLEGE